MKKALNRWTFLYVLATIVVFAAIYFAYQVVVQVPEDNATMKFMEQNNKTVYLRECIGTATSTYDSTWASDCQTLYDARLQGYNSCIQEYPSNPESCSVTYGGVENEIFNPDCQMSPDQANALNQKLQNDEDNCYKEYPAQD